MNETYRQTHTEVTSRYQLSDRNTESRFRLYEQTVEEKRWLTARERKRPRV